MSEHAVAAPRRPVTLAVTPVVRNTLQRCGGKPCSCAKDEDGTTIHRQRAWDGGEPATVPPIVTQVLRSPGQPLDDNARGFMESRFGHDFGRVRVHVDTRAAESARAIDAVAYTLGNNVVFGSGQYQPRSLDGLGLLAHELTHVVQQRHIPTPLQQEPVIGGHDDVHEREANRAAATLEPALTLDSPAAQPRIRPAKGEGIGAAVGALVGGIAGGIFGGLPGAILGGLAGAGLGYLVGRLFRGNKITTDAGCKGHCTGVNIEDEAKKADAKTSDKCREVTFNYVKGGAGPAKVFSEKIEFSNVTLKCNAANPNCGGWSTKGLITLGKGSCSAASCGPLASTILHEMVHDWAGLGAPYDKKEYTVPGATRTTADFLDEWAGRYIEKSCFGYNPWGLP
jgi:hypothetical protein